MKRIVGIVGFEPGRFSLDDLEAMLDPLKRRGFRPDARWTGPTSLLATADSQRGVEILSQARESGFPIVADARLDERDILAAKLDITRKETPGDAELIYRAWQRWGERCVDHLLGDFAFAIWDEAGQSLFCARDHIGCKPFYYSHGDGWFAFASEVKSLLGLDCVEKAVNKPRLADFLVPELENIYPRETFFKGVSRLLPANTLTLKSRSMHECSYWSLRPERKYLLNTSKDYAEGLIEVLGKAVKSRLCPVSDVGVMLSGGIDSSAIAAVAIEQSAEPGAKLRTLSAVSADGSGGETEAINTVINALGTASVCITPAEFAESSPSPSEYLLEMDDLFDASMITIAMGIYQRARSEGITVVLDGIDGDLVAGYTGPMAISNLLLTGNIAAATAELRYIARRDGVSVSSAYWHQAVRPLLAALVPLRLKSGILERRARSKLSQVLTSVCLSEEFAMEIDLRQRLLEYERSLPRSLSHAGGHAQAVGHFHLMSGIERYERSAAFFGVESRHPLLDKRFLEYCVNLPPTEKSSLGINKILLRRIMANRLPPAVVTRAYADDESLFGEFRGEWLARNQEELRRIARGSVNDTSNFLDEGSAAKVLNGQDRTDESVLETLNDGWHVILMKEWYRMNDGI